MSLDGGVYQCTDEEVGHVAECFPASPDAVELVLSKPSEGDNNRSDWKWVRLINGDLILGVFPQGDTYFEIEGAVEADWVRARQYDAERRVVEGLKRMTTEGA